MKTILIVDDNIENLYLLRIILEQADYSVIDAKNGKEGLEILQQVNVDMIISDILMPIMDGYIFCQTCKNKKDFRKIPFLFYTATYTEQKDEEFALKLGAAKFIKKSIDHDEFLLIIQDVFDKTSSQKENLRRIRINDQEVLKLYSESLINKLEDKALELKNEIVERKKVEQLLIHENHIMDLISHNTPLNKVLEHIILNFESVHSGYLGSVNLAQNNVDYLKLASAPSMPKGYNIALSHIPIGDNIGSCGTAAFSKKPVIVSDISYDKLWTDYKHIAEKYNLKSCWSIPILTKENVVLGTFAIYSNQVKTPSLDDVRELNSTVNLATLAIEKNNIISEIKKREESYKSLIEQANDAIITYALDGTISDFNHAASNSLGYTKEEFVKLNIKDFVVGGLAENSQNYTQMKYGKPVIIYRQLIRKDGTVFEAEISTKLQKDGKMMLGIARDITERKKAETNLKQKNLELIKTNEELDSFVYSASHDLRAPLTSLMGLINIVELGLKPDQEEQKSQLQMMSKTIDKMDLFINNILDYSRNSRLEVKREKIDFNKLIESCWGQLKSMDLEKNHKITINVNQQSDFFSDKGRLEIIFINIISNAIKYYDSAKGDNDVNIWVNADSKTATIIIEDNGVGIGKEYLNKIFDMFYRATKFSKGSGMGMYIVKETIDKLKGSIKVESKLKEGSKFTITLPNHKNLQLA